MQIVDLRWHWKNYDGNSRGEPIYLVTGCKYWLKQPTFNLECVNNIDDVAFEVESTVVRTRVRNLQPVDGDAHLLLWLLNVFHVCGWWIFTFGNDLWFFRFFEVKTFSSPLCLANGSQWSESLSAPAVLLSFGKSSKTPFLATYFILSFMLENDLEVICAYHLTILRPCHHRTIWNRKCTFQLIILDWQWPMPCYK